MKSLHVAAIGVIAAILSTSLSYGQGVVVDFTAGTLHENGDNIDKSGKVITAVDFIDTSVSDEPHTPMINGIKFESDDATGKDIASSNPNPHYALTCEGIDNGRGGTSSGTITALVNDGVFHVSDNHDTVNPTGGFALVGLKPGTKYSVQLFFSSGNSDTRSVSVTDGTTKSPIVTTGQSPQYITEIFIAKDTSENLTINNNSVAPGSAAQLSGFVLEELPVQEPQLQ